MLKHAIMTRKISFERLKQFDGGELLIFKTISDSTLNKVITEYVIKHSNVMQLINIHLAPTKCSVKVKCTYYELYRFYIYLSENCNDMITNIKYKEIG